MGNIQIVTDSTAAFTRQEILDMKLEIVPLSIHFQNETFDEGLPDTYAEYYDRLADSKTLPTTSQPAVGRFYEVFQQAVSQGKKVVAILLSSGLSGTVGSAQMAAELAGGDVTVIDSLGAVSNLKKLVQMAWQAAEGGAAVEEIKTQLAAQIPTMRAILTVGDLIYLKRGGRLNNSQYYVGKLLNILPLILLRDGKLFPYGKVKGEKALGSAFLQVPPADTKGITVLHINNLEKAEELRRSLLTRFPQSEIGIEPISPVIGSHLGTGAYGFTFYS